MDPIRWSCFCFIEIFILGLIISLAINGVVGLAISGAMSTKREVSVIFFGLTIW